MLVRVVIFSAIRSPLANSPFTISRGHFLGFYLVKRRSYCDNFRTAKYRLSNQKSHTNQWGSAHSGISTLCSHKLNPARGWFEGPHAVRSSYTPLTFAYIDYPQQTLLAGIKQCPRDLFATCRNGHPLFSAFRKNRCGIPDCASI